MKKYPLFFFLALIILIASILTPEVVYASLPKVEYIKVEKTTADKSVSVLGKIKSEEENAQTADYAYFVSEILINTGDYITQGERILKIDLEKTKLIYTQKGVEYTGETYITSDFEGTVSNINIQKGTAVTENSLLINVIDTNKLCASLTISEDVFSQIKIGQKAKITGSAFKNTYNAKITKIGAVANQTAVSPTYVEAIAEIENPDKTLKPGFNIKAKITTKKLKNAIIIPSNCISQDDTDEFVYKLVENKAQKVYIKTGSITSKGTIVKSGIKNGDYIISNPEVIEKDNSYVSLEE